MTPTACLSPADTHCDVCPGGRRAPARDPGVPLSVRIVNGHDPKQDRMIRRRAQADRLLTLRRRIQRLRRSITEAGKTRQPQADD